jgi:RimJ/RimL family protein N-acetyltransferase
VSEPADPASGLSVSAADVPGAGGDPPSLRFPFDASALTDAPLHTERLVLRPIEASDAADVYEYQRLEEVIRYLPWPPRNRVEAYEHTAKRAAGRMLAADGDFFVFAATLPGEPSIGDAGSPRDRVIGDFMVRVSSVEHAQLELGWVLHPDFQGRGYAREAAGAVLEFTFETLGAHRVQAFLDARNAASAALCVRLGMRREATIVEEEFHDGEWTDTAVYGVLRREWAAARR